MAKYEANLSGNLDVILQAIDHEVLNGISATFEDGSDIQVGDTRCAVRVYERYSMTGGNRVSLNITLVGSADDVFFLSAIASGGSQAAFFKINTFGEEQFLNRLIGAVQQFT
jgi:hypothetical protein